MAKSSSRSRKKRKDSVRAADRPRPVEEASASDGTLSRHAPLLIVLVAMTLVGLVRLRVAGIPLERDEGEYAYAGQLILQGIPPYQLAYNMKFPGTYYAFGLIEALFGQTAWGIHVGLIFVNAATILAVFFLGRRLLGRFGGVIAAVAFAVLSLDRWTMGVFAHATHFVILPVLTGLIVLFRATDSRRPAGFVGAGVLLGTAVLMKQQGIFFLPLAVALIVWQNARPFDLRRMVLHNVLLGVGALLPFLLLCALFLAQGVFGKFWFWTFQYAREYVSEVPLSAAWQMFAAGWQGITQSTLPMWLLAGAGVVLLWIVRWPTEVRVFLTGLLCASLLALSPGFYFRPHYFILLLPSAALFAGVACESIRRIAGRVVPAAQSRAIAVVLFAVVVGAYAVDEQEYLVSLPARDISRDIYGMNPFVEAVDIAHYISEHTNPTDRIAVLGSEPEIYFYANRKSATGHIYTYGMMEQQPYAVRMQDEMIHEVESVHPEYVVFVTMNPSWLVRRANEKILRWAHQYTRQCYVLAGVADIYSLERSELLWDASAASYKPRSENTVYTFHRKSDVPCIVSNRMSDSGAKHHTGATG